MLTLDPKLGVPSLKKLERGFNLLDKTEFESIMAHDDFVGVFSRASNVRSHRVLYAGQASCPLFTMKKYILHI